jgi:hypothetical protein
VSRYRYLVHGALPLVLFLTNQNIMKTSKNLIFKNGYSINVLGLSGQVFGEKK